MIAQYHVTSRATKGQDGTDSLLFFSANIAENVDVLPNGSGVTFFRNIANVTIDLDARLVTLNLAVVGGAGDGQADNLTVLGTSASDTANVTGSTAGGVRVDGLATVVAITGSQPANDRLTINLLANDDVVDASRLIAGLIQLTADAGAGNDVLIGSAVADTLLGGPGDDVLFGGPGVDVLDGGPGDNFVVQD